MVSKFAFKCNLYRYIKDWILIFISSMLFDAPISNTQLGGYMLAFLAVCYYNYVKFKEKEAAAKAGESSSLASGDQVKSGSSR
jgi:hypothetical protein